MIKRFHFILFLFLAGIAPLYTQVKPTDASIMPEEYNPDEFPLWAHDLRRFEVITFGAFPVAFFFSSLAYDLTLLASNDFSSQYNLGTQRSNDDISTIIITASITSALIATADLFFNIATRKNSGEERSQQKNNARQ